MGSLLPALAESCFGKPSYGHFLRINPQFGRFFFTSKRFTCIQVSIRLPNGLGPGMTGSGLKEDPVKPEIGT
jgi:hypothetical protein